MTYPGMQVHQLTLRVANGSAASFQAFCISRSMIPPLEEINVSERRTGSSWRRPVQAEVTKSVLLMTVFSGRAA